MAAPKIIFVHGMNANADSWNGLQSNPTIKSIWPETEAITLAGHFEPAFAPGAEPDPSSGIEWCPRFLLSLAGPPNTDATMDAYVASVKKAFPPLPAGGAPVRDVILVGHSMGGAVISQVAALADFEPRIRQLVYVCAMYPSRDDSIGGLKDQILADAVEANEFDAFGVCKDFKPHLPECSPALVKQPTGPQDRKFEPTHEFEQIEKVYIRGTMDRIIPPSAQSGMLNRSPDTPVIHDLKSSHLPQYSKPAELVELLKSTMKRDSA